MFEEITLKNFRTHKSTTIHLKPVTLLIGNNNSGKTNFLAGIQHFSRLVRRAETSRTTSPTVEWKEDYWQPLYRQAGVAESLSISIVWINSVIRPLRFGVVLPGEINYEMILYPNPEKKKPYLLCKEQITIELAEAGAASIERSGYDEPTNSIALRKKIETGSTLQEEEKALCLGFFHDFANIFSYHLQPSFLKGLVESRRSGQPKAIEKDAINELYGEREGRIVEIFTRLGYEGGNLQTLLLEIKERDEETFSRFTALLRRFAGGFHGVRYDSEQAKPIWEFDLGRKTGAWPKEEQKLLEQFSPELISGGVLKAAAISLLVSLQRFPGLVMLEEIENGINPGNTQELLDWIWQATAISTWGPQFILTSHSPVVLRDFYDRLDHVYNLRLDQRRLRSDVLNLNDALKTLVSLGTVEGDIDEETGLVQIPQEQLTELWFSGAIG